MYRFALTVAIDAPPAHVWRALCDPAEVVLWDGGVTQALDAPPDYPRPGQHVRWRFRRGLFRTLHDRPQEVVPERRLRALLGVGPWRFDEVYTLTPRAGGSSLTVTMEVRAPGVPLGGTFARVILGPRTRTSVEASLRAIKHHCERQPGGGPGDDERRAR